MGEGAGHTSLEDAQLCLHRGISDTHKTLDKPVGLNWVIFFFLIFHPDAWGSPITGVF